uniref:COesterase domain-containing protein n=1 Tax=Steinernema glaseri TaxID=37863 RepID=A0A1I8ARZ1_9BILA
MVLLPVPIETTVQHVAETTLPSARGLTIMVNADFDKRLVSMRKVVAALNWLKQNNPFYRIPMSGWLKTTDFKSIKVTKRITKR